jgi:hypothetical protein
MANCNGSTGDIFTSAGAQESHTCTTGSIVL